MTEDKQQKTPGKTIERLGNQEAVNRLIASGVRGMFDDGANLYLQLKGSTASYIFRYYARTGRVPELGLGGARIGARRAVTVREARQRAKKFNDMLAAGDDPQEAKKAKKAEAKKAVFFGALVPMVHATVTGVEKTRADWLAAIKHVSGLNGKLLTDITTAAIAEAVKPTWKEAPTMAKKAVRQVRQMFEYAQAHGMVDKDKENPAKWEQIEILNGDQEHTPEHRTALKYEDAPRFVAWLRKHKKREIALALEFTILTAGRASETCGATWGEIEGDLFTLPPERMLKTETEHTVPLCARARQILAGLKRGAPDTPVFMTKGSKRRPGVQMYPEALLDMVKEFDPELNATTHGFRSTFRDWCGDATDTARELAESALSHLPADPVEAAYRRRKAIEKRRPLMEKWCKFLNGK